jgi:hypothetical protein
VPDFATSRASDRAAFADRERGEVVIEHELLAELFLQAVDPLLIASGAQRDVIRAWVSPRWNSAEP